MFFKKKHYPNLKAQNCWEKVSELARKLDEEIGRYNDPSEIDQLRKKLADASDVLNYLRDEEQVLQLRKNGH